MKKTAIIAAVAFGVFGLPLCLTSDVALANQERKYVMAPKESPWLHATRETIRLRESFGLEQSGVFEMDEHGDVQVTSSCKGSSGEEIARGLIIAGRARLVEKEMLWCGLAARASAMAVLNYLFPEGPPIGSLPSQQIERIEEHASFSPGFISYSLFQPAGGTGLDPPWSVTGVITGSVGSSLVYHFELRRLNYIGILDGTWARVEPQLNLPDSMALGSLKLESIVSPNGEGNLQKSNRLITAKYHTLGELRRTLLTGELPLPGAGELGPAPQTELELGIWLQDALRNGHRAEEVRFFLEKADWYPINPKLLGTADLHGDGSEEWFLAVVPPSSPADGVPVDGPEGTLWIIDKAGIVLRIPGKNLGLKFAVDMTGDGISEAVIISSHCGAHTCVSDIAVVSADGGSVRNVVTADRSPNDLVSISYPSEIVLTDAKVPELRVKGGGIGSAGAGVHRERTETWGWNGRSVILKRTDWEKTNWRHHVLYDGNISYKDGRWDEARQEYLRVIEDESLKDDPSWGKSRESCEQFAAFRLSLVALRRDRDEEATQWCVWLTKHYPGAPLSNAAAALIRAWEVRRDLAVACAAAGEILSKESHPTGSLENMGYGNPSLKADDVCSLR